jgi:hypothetical protein
MERNKVFGYGKWNSTMSMHVLVEKGRSAESNTVSWKSVMKTILCVLVLNVVELLHYFLVWCRELIVSMNWGVEIIGIDEFHKKRCH